MICRTHIHLILVAMGGLFLPAAQAAAAEQGVAEWTLLVHMNGTNKLERFAIADFEEMAKVGSTSEINVVVQMGRLAGDPERRHGDWSGVRRYLVKKGDVPDVSTSLVDLAAEGEST